MERTNRMVLKISNSESKYLTDCYIIYYIISFIILLVKAYPHDWIKLMLIKGRSPGVMRNSIHNFPISG